jgi:hypothetical protein
MNNNNNNANLFGPGTGTPVVRTLDQAIATGDVNEVRTVLQSVANYDGQAAIRSAVNEPIFMDDEMLPPLHYTLVLARRRDITRLEAFAILQLLLASGALWNLKDSTKKTPLQIAMQNHMLDEAYLIAGASGNSALMKQMIRRRRDRVPSSIVRLAERNSGPFTNAIKNVIKKEYTRRRRHALHAFGRVQGTLKRSASRSSRSGSNKTRKANH